MQVKRLLQFRLRSLLLVMALVAIPMAWLGRQIHESRRQRALVESLEANGAEIAFNNEATSLPEWLDTGYCSRIERVDFQFADVSDVSAFSGLKNLEELSLGGTQVSDEQVAFLRKVLPGCTVVVLP